MARTIMLTEYEPDDNKQAKYHISGFTDVYWTDDPKNALACIARDLGIKEGNMTSYFEAFRARVLDASEDEITLDSEWVFWPTDNRGHYTAAALRVLADELDRRNKELESEEEV